LESFECQHYYDSKNSESFFTVALTGLQLESTPDSKALSNVIFHFYEIKLSVIEKAPNDTRMTKNSICCPLYKKLRSNFVVEVSTWHILTFSFSATNVFFSRITAPQDPMTTATPTTNCGNDCKCNNDSNDE